MCSNLVSTGVVTAFGIGSTKRPENQPSNMNDFYRIVAVPGGKILPFVVMWHSLLGALETAFSTFVLFQSTFWPLFEPKQGCFSQHITVDTLDRWHPASCTTYLLHWTSSGIQKLLFLYTWTSVSRLSSVR